MQQQAETITRRVLRECEVCSGSGLNPTDTTAEGICGVCGGRGKVSAFEKIERPLAPVVSVVAPSTYTAPAEVELAPAPSAPSAPSYMVFHNPDERVDVQPLLSVPPGQVWLLGPDGNFTKIGAGT